MWRGRSRWHARPAMSPALLAGAERSAPNPASAPAPQLRAARASGSDMATPCGAPRVLNLSAEKPTVPSALLLRSNAPKTSYSALGSKPREPGRFEPSVRQALLQRSKCCADRLGCDDFLGRRRGPRHDPIAWELRVSRHNLPPQDNPVARLESGYSPTRAAGSATILPRLPGRCISTDRRCAPSRSNWAELRYDADPGGRLWRCRPSPLFRPILRPVPPTPARRPIRGGQARPS